MRISDWSSDVCSSDLFKSTTTAIPEVRTTPRHIAIIMDGNGRWARKRMMPRVAGHKRGAESVRGTVRADRKSVVSGTSGSVRVDIGGRRIIIHKPKQQPTYTYS